MNNTKKSSDIKKDIDTSSETNTDIESAIPKIKYNLFISNKKIDNHIDKNVITNQDSSFILKKTKKTGNYQIVKKSLNKTHTENCVLGVFRHC